MSDETTLYVRLAGQDVTSRTRLGSLHVSERLGSAPNKAALTFDDEVPGDGLPIKIGVGSLNDEDLIFAGQVLGVDDSYEQVAEQSLFIWPVQLVDHVYRLNRRRPFGAWTNVSGTVIGQFLFDNYVASDEFTAEIEADLPEISIAFDGSEDWMTCWRRLANELGGRGTVEYDGRVRLFITDTETGPDELNADNPPLNDPPLTFSIDHSQVRTRIYGKGYGQNLLSDVNQYETILPIPDASVFSVLGGRAIAALAPDARTSEQITYSGVELGGGGSLVGPGAAPVVAPTGVAVVGSAGVPTGTPSYAVTYVTGSGESLPSPLGAVPVGGRVADPTVAPGCVNSGSGGGWGAGTPYRFRYAYSTGASTSDTSKLTLLSPRTRLVSDGTAITFTIPYSTDPGVTYIAIFFYSLGDSDPAETSYVTETPPYSAGGAFIIANNSAGGNLVVTINPTGNSGAIVSASGSNTSSTRNHVALTIPLGTTTVTQRKIYRTPSGSAQLKLLATVADNTTTAYADSTADGSLGANAPTSDTSGLTQPPGQVNAGETSLLLASTAPFLSGGGWVIGPGSALIRYTGISGNSLTGIPSSGPGSIQTTLLYSSQVLPAPALTGVNAAISPNGVQKAMLKGAAVHIWVQRDDTLAQAALGALQLKENGSPTDGIREDTITDERRNEESLIALCDATLDKISRPIVSVRGAVKDKRCRAGRVMPIDITIGFYDSDFYDSAFYKGARRGTTGDFTIQTVDIEYDAPGQLPTRRFMASSVSFRFVDLLGVSVLKG